jgi:hypothetical protein
METKDVMTGVGRHADAVAGLPGDFAGVARVVQGLFMHEFLGDHYGISLTPEERETVHLRKAEDLLDAVLARDGRPLAEAREPGRRVATNCRGFTVVAVAMLRAHGVRARARCGFGAYFTEGFFEDHWVVEYHDGGRWRRGDAQIDATQRAVFGIGDGVDVTDLPPGAFLTGGEAWELVRAGRADPDRFGLSGIGESGDWWIAGNLVRDVAALDGAASLPWDVWEPMPEPGDAFDPAVFDRMAAGQVPVTVPGEVFNVQRKRVEPFA